MLKQVLSSSVTYVAASAAASLVSLLLLPVYARLLTPADFGVLGVLTATLGLLTRVVGLSPQLFFTARFQGLSGAQVRETVGAVVFLGATTAIPALAVLCLVFDGFVAVEVPAWVPVALVGLSVSSAIRVTTMTVEKMRERPVRVAALQLGGVGAEHMIALVLVGGLGLGWQGRFAGAGIGLASSAIAAWLLLRHLGFATLWPSVTALRRYVRFSLPLVPHALGYWAIEAADRYFLVGFCGVEDTGIYSVAYRLCMAFPLLASGVLSAYAPLFYAPVLNQESKRWIVRFSYGYVGVLWSGTALFVLAAPMLVPWLLGSKFEPAVVHIPWIAGAYALGAVRDLAAGYLYRAGRTPLLAAITLAAAALNATLNWLLIPRLGPVGAAVATTVTFAFACLPTLWFALRAEPMPWLSPFDRHR